MLTNNQRHKNVNTRQYPVARVVQCREGVGLVIKRSRIRFAAGALPGSLGQLSLPSLGVGKSSTSLLHGVKSGGS